MASICIFRIVLTASSCVLWYRERKKKFSGKHFERKNLIKASYIQPRTTLRTLAMRVTSSFSSLAMSMSYSSFPLMDISKIKSFWARYGVNKDRLLDWCTVDPHEGFWTVPSPGLVRDWLAVVFLHELLPARTFWNLHWFNWLAAGDYIPLAECEIYYKAKYYRR